MDKPIEEHRRYCLYFIVTSFVIILSNIAIVAFVDPLWYFDHSHKLNKFGHYKDERQIKTNRLVNTSTSFDSILLGSSRSSYINTDVFENMQLFNFAVSSFYPDEYMGYVDAFTQYHSRPKNIVIGVDFYASRAPKVRTFRTPESYITGASSRADMLANLSSFSALKSAIKNITTNINTDKRIDDKSVYDRRLVKYRDQVANSDKKRPYHDKRNYIVASIMTLAIG